MTNLDTSHARGHVYGKSDLLMSYGDGLGSTSVGVVDFDDAALLHGLDPSE